MDDEARDVIRTLAEGCVHFVRQAVGVELDGTPQTLPVLDHYLGLARSDDARGREAVLDLVGRAAGAYFGEVVRRAVPGARWALPDEEAPQTWRIELDHVFLAFNPVGMAREAITERDEPGWGAHLEVLAQDRPVLTQALENVGPVGERDYYRLAVRWEVVEQAIGVLQAAAFSRGQREVSHGPDVYRRLLDERPPGAG